jgi:hypothetical protein
MRCYARISLSPPLRPGVGIREIGFFKLSKPFEPILKEASTAEMLFSFLHHAEMMFKDILCKYFCVVPILVDTTFYNMAD